MARLEGDRIRHTVAFRLKRSTDEADFLAAAAGLAAIQGVDEFEILREVSPKNAFAFGISMEFADRSAYEAYNEHPDHVDENADVEQIATGFTFTEGPIWMKDGSLHFSDMPADKRRRWHPEEGVTVLRDPSNKCNGMTRDNDGSLIVCEHVTSSVVREKPDGTRETLATHWGDKELNSPNDVIVARDGSIVFTDPTYGRMPGFGLEREQDLDFQGVYRIPAGGGELELLVDDFVQPNGLCFSPDESLLYVNDTDRAHVRVFDVGPDGSLSNGRVFAEGIGDGDLAKGGLVDGM